MRKLFLSIAVFVMALCANAQTNQYFWYQGSLMMGNPIAQIDSVTFGENEPADTLHILLPRTIIKEVHDTVYVTIHDTVCPNALPAGALSGGFSVSATKKVRFSQGNLQYQASTDTWRFAENQYDYIGSDNNNISSTYEGWIDLFGWGTSGYDNTANDPFAVNYQPWSKSWSHIYQQCTINSVDYNSEEVNRYGYGPSTFMPNANLTGSSANYDWGVYNAIINGGNQAGLWRSLTGAEWYYLLKTRPSAQNLHSRATVCDKHGLILLPDNFILPEGVSWSTQDEDWTTNVYNADNWVLMENSGAVFLPAAGYRYDGYTGTYEVESHGRYWSSSYREYVQSGCLDFIASYADLHYTYRYHGCSVRLVQDIEK